MRSIVKISVITLVFLSIGLFYSCKKDRPSPPVVTTAAVSDISFTTAVSGGEVVNEGGVGISSRGICWNTDSDPTIANFKTSEIGATGIFASNLIQLVPNTLYYVRAYATNSAGTGYGSQVTFTTRKATTALLSTATPSEITSTSANSGGTITSENGSSVTVRGVCWGLTTNPTTSNSKTVDGNGTGAFGSSLSALKGSSTYFVRAYATNSEGTSYGNEISFTTLSPVLPLLSTSQAASVTSTSSKCGGTIKSDGGSDITERGICWSTGHNPDITGSKISDITGIEEFTGNLTGLIPNTTYYIRSYATNSVGTGYGSELDFKTYAAIDPDGHGYYSVKIGTQDWFTENLRTTKYTNGDVIGTTSPAILDISNQNAPKYQWAFNGDEANAAVYGRLYTWYTITDSRKVCPAGWHVPSDGEWIIMEEWLNANGYNYDGSTSYDTYNKISKSLAAIILWKASSREGAIGNTDYSGYRNKTGFSALPGSQRSSNGVFGLLLQEGDWWSSTEIDAQFAWLRGMYYDASNFPKFGNVKENAFSVRCLKDN